MINSLNGGRRRGLLPGKLQAKQHLISTSVESGVVDFDFSIEFVCLSLVFAELR